MPAPRKRSYETDRAFLAALASGEPVRTACRAAGCSRQALYRRRIRDNEFDCRWREAEAAARVKKACARPRKRIGTTLPVFAPHGRHGHKKVLSDGLLLARLKALRPFYRDTPCATRMTVVEAGKDAAAIRLLRRLVRERKLSLSDVPKHLRPDLGRPGIPSRSCGMAHTDT